MKFCFVRFFIKEWIHLHVHTTDCLPSAPVLARLGRALGVRPAHLMTGVPSAFRDHLIIGGGFVNQELGISFVSGVHQ